MSYEIVLIENLKPLELVFPEHLRNLSRMIVKDEAIKLPIYADKKTGTILDGSHRYAFCWGSGLLEAPVRWVDYDSEHVRVGTHLAHRFEVEGDINISKAEVIRRGLEGDLYQPRTTRHFFPFRKDLVNVPLSSLKRLGGPRDISHLIAKVSIEEEIKHNEGYLEELEQELETLKSYEREAERTKVYLQEQVKAMKQRTDSEVTMDDLFAGI